MTWPLTLFCFVKCGDVAIVGPVGGGVLCMWCGVAWCGVVWCGVAWRGTAWRGVAWCGMAWHGVVFMLVACTLIGACRWWLNGVVPCGVALCVVWRGVVWCLRLLCALWLELVDGGCALWCGTVVWHCVALCGTVVSIDNRLCVRMSVLVSTESEHLACFVKRGDAELVGDGAM